jgi:hypothetical protein
VTVSKLRLKISMSLDGFVAGPDQSLDNPLEIGGMRLHEWVVPLAAWRGLHGLPSGEINESARVVEESIANIGATGRLSIIRSSCSRITLASRWCWKERPSPS